MLEFQCLIDDALVEELLEQEMQRMDLKDEDLDSAQAVVEEDGGADS